MAEVLTESFCERCGTRYTFESARPRVKRLKGVKVLSRGLKNFVLSDDSSLDEAMAAARSDTERESSSQQLDAFHKTFNFCMTCRQYTCANCWNEPEGACLTCSPHLGREIMPAPFPDLDPSIGLTIAMDPVEHAHGNGANGNGHATPLVALDAWPTSDLPQSDDDGPSIHTDPDEIDVVARMAALTAIGAGSQTRDDEPFVEADVLPVAEVQAEEPVETEAPVEVVAEVQAEGPVETEAPVEVGPVAGPANTEEIAAAASLQTAALLRRFRPGQNLDDEIEAYEREQAERGAMLSVVGAADQEREPVAAVEAEPEPAEPVAAEPAPAMVAAVDVEVIPAAAAVDARPIDVVEQPTWRIIAPDAEPTVPVVPPAAPVIVPPPGATAAPPPEWPAKPEWPSQRPSGGLPFLGRTAQPTGGLDSLWAESNREVATAAPAAGRPAASSVQPCVSCGLSLSATARFCRRCGTSQAG